MNTERLTAYIDLASDTLKMKASMINLAPTTLRASSYLGPLVVTVMIIMLPEVPISLETCPVYTLRRVFAEFSLPNFERITSSNLL